MRAEKAPVYGFVPGNGVTMKILLVCGAGMSTSILMNKMKKHAEDNGIELEIAATSVESAPEMSDEYDVILMGPQVSYRKGAVEESTGKPVAVIPPADYGMANCPNVFKLAESLLA